MLFWDHQRQHFVCLSMDEIVTYLILDNSTQGQIHNDFCSFIHTSYVAFQNGTGENRIVKNVFMNVMKLVYTINS